MTAAISVLPGLRAAMTAGRFFFLFFLMQCFFFLLCAALTAAAASSSLPYAAHGKYKPYRNHSKDCIIQRFHFPVSSICQCAYSRAISYSNLCFTDYQNQLIPYLNQIGHAQRICLPSDRCLQKQSQNVIYHKCCQPCNTALQKHYRQRTLS